MLTSKNVNENYSNFSQEELDIMYKANPKLTYEINPIDGFSENKYTVKYVLQPKPEQKML